MSSFIDKVTKAVESQKSIYAKAKTDPVFFEYLGLANANTYSAQAICNLNEKLIEEFDYISKLIDKSGFVPESIKLNPFSESEFFDKELKEVKDCFYLGYSASQPNCGLSFELKNEFYKELGKAIPKPKEDIESENKLIDWVFMFAVSTALGAIFASKNYKSDTDVFIINSDFAVNPKHATKIFIEKSISAFFELDNLFVSEITNLINTLKTAGICSKRFSITSSGKAVILLH